MKKQKIKLFKSQKGQMALFIALIFQVLFVFFAMIVNVGLIVHDKINLQNSVDLAAYYAAQRQAEMLNAIGHYNYQIRQAWKLLAFRYRVLGDLGFKEHPIQREGFSFPDVAAYVDGESSTGGRAPNVCVNHSFWGYNQNLCFNSRIDIPKIPNLPVINFLLPTNFAASNLIQNFARDAEANCKATAGLNFNLLIKWLLAYRTQISNSKIAVRKYADLLSNSPSDFVDIRGQSATQGALKTFQNNLTRANRESLVENSFQVTNSLGGIPRKQWLNEVLVLPRFLYAQTKTGGGRGCVGVAVAIDGVGQPNDGLPDGMSTTPAIEFARKESNVDDYLYHSSFGFEKNPWVMAYVKVQAETEPRKPFLPFGKPIRLRAQAYAKPFGGRVGPWFYNKWPRGSVKSVGNQFDRTDPLLPTEFDPEEESISESSQVLPNYARFPGDALGLRSQAALGMFKRSLLNYFRASAQGAAVQPISPLFYEGTPANGDGLAQLPASGANLNNSLALGYSGPWIRDFEVAAISPDQFDAIYYSIDPDSYSNYTLPGREAIFANQTLPLDLGSLFSSFPIGIAKQIEVAERLKSPDSSMNFYMIKNPDHLLTGWAPSGAYSYEFPESFGKCTKRAGLPVPGDCAMGGRTGYSVKIVSKSFLKSSDIPLGGSGQRGPILNAPRD